MLALGPDRARPSWIGELAVVAFLVLVYDRVADLAQVRVDLARSRGRALLELERSWHVAVEGRLDAAVGGNVALGRVLALYYDLAHVAVALTVLVVLYVRWPHHYRRARSALVGVNAVGLAVFLAWPVAPPRLLPGAGFVDVVARSRMWGTSSAVAAHANQYASMPSLHVAWAMWVALAVGAGTTCPALRGLALAHAVVTVTVVVVTGNHYLLDVFAGAGVSAACWSATGLRRPGPARAPVAARSPAGPESVL